MPDYISKLIEQYPPLEAISDGLYTAFDLLCCCCDSGGKLLICGNGGSAADSEHIVGELMKGFLLKRELSQQDKELFENMADSHELADRLQGALPAIALSAHGALCSAVANDVDADMVYAQQVWGYSKNSPDALIALSTSGNSANVVNAVKTAKALGIDTVGITGQNESELSRLCTVCLRLPETQTYKIQELCLPVYHAICAALEDYFFGKE